MMKVLSFDVGIRNLAYAHVTVDVKESRIVQILHWNKIDLHEFGDGGGGGSVVTSVIDAMLKSAPVLSDPSAWDVVLIENQPSLKNPVMKTVQVAIHAFFEMVVQTTPLPEDDNPKTHRILLVNARNKVGSCGGSYSERKRESIKRCLSYVDGMAEGASFLASTKKIDDMCDAFMQAVWFVEHHKIAAATRKKVLAST